MNPTRVVIADDSAFMRRLISDVLTRAKMEVVATAANGREAIEACRLHKPDVLSLDLAMPEVDGMAVLRDLRTMPDLQIVVVSSFSESEGVRAVDTLAEGAFDLVPKQSSSGKLQDFLDDLLAKVEAAASVQLRPRKTDRAKRGRVDAGPHHDPDGGPTNHTDAAGGGRSHGAATAKHPKKPRARGGRLAVVASSTGGPRALTVLVKALPATLGQGLLIVQHMPTGFTKSLAARLNDYSKLSIAEAADGDKIAAGRGYVAPGGRHMQMHGGRIALSDAAPVSGLRPCADITITDAVHQFGSSIVLAVLTGMGRDGCKGAGLVHEAGGIVIAEHGDTTTVNGMPKAVIDAGFADYILPIDEIAEALSEAANG